MNSKTVHIESFGCQMNKLDSAMVTAALKEDGFMLIDSAADADVVLINTCSVREHAERKVLSHLGNLKHIKQSGRGEMVVAVIGCMAQRMGAELLEHEAVNIVCGPAQIPQVVTFINDTIREKKKVLAVTEDIRRGDGANRALENFESVYDSDDKTVPNQAFVRVMRGCNNFCSYCIVPYVRGPEVSRPPHVVIEQIKRLAAEGIKQVTLLGQAVNLYQYENAGLADLLEMASDIDGIEWIRFVTSYPAKKGYRRLLEAMADLPKVCGYLHMPAQSGSDRILKAMNRKYTAQEYIEMVEMARQIVPRIAIAGDFIVGFPGETDEDFQQSVSLVQQIRYKNCFVFKYSPRAGTRADDKLADSVSLEVKKQRNIELLRVQEKISGQLSAGYMGQKVRVLVEGLSKKPHLNAEESEGCPQLVARTAEDMIVVFNGSPELAGQFTDVEIEKTSPLTLFGKLI
ncbi:tRNA (N6-isopentenyl adenosine(37)-C2)-methylthiotransferase MiaB [Planctomycetota bacterium]